MEEKKIQPAREMSFLELIKDYVILIPVIQRDYAQGRKTEEVNKIREDFVHDLLSFINDKENSHNIDFIYGTVEQKEGRPKTFIPLDGQQRLTTLFLLHLYLAGISQHYNSFYNNVNGRFEYATRKSSTEFCRRIVSHDVCKELLEIRESKSKTKLSDVIENQGWFFSSWKQDPTVQGMLVMLDEIDRQVMAGNDNINSLYDNLFENSKRPIVFQWQPLDNYTLTDDLYIKMNARGLRLTDFEVFKALYELSLNCVEDKKKNAFTTQIDGDWCDFFWQRKEKLGSTDSVMERILRLMIALGYARQEKSKDKDEGEYQDILDNIFYRNKKKIPFAYSEYRKLDVFHDTHKKPETVGENLKKQENDIAQCVIEAFNVICKKDSSPLDKICCSPWYTEQEKIKNILTEDFEKLTYDDFVYFYAFVSFSDRYKGENLEYELKSWMRYVHNLINATIINDSPQLAGVIRSIDKIIKSINNCKVLSWISMNPSVDAFSTNQSYEEAVKAKLILWGEKKQQPQWKDIIELNEQDKYMRGQIGFLLVSTDVYTLNEAEFDSQICNKTLQDFCVCSLKARNIFAHFKDNKDNKDNDDKLITDHLLERALLTKGMYLKSASRSRMNFCNHPNDRDYSWRKMLEITPQQPLTAGVSAMKELLCDKWEDNNDPIKSLSNIIDVFLSSGNHSEWYVPFIKKEGIDLLDECHKGFIHIQNDTITLLRESQMNHYHSELKTILLKYEMEKQYPFIQYCYVRSSEEHPGIYFRIKISEIVATIYIYYQDNWYLEVWDEHMYDYLQKNSYDWSLCNNELSRILSNDSYNGDVLQINREDIKPILSKSEKKIYHDNDNN